MAIGDVVQAGDADIVNVSSSFTATIGDAPAEGNTLVVAVGMREGNDTRPLGFTAITSDIACAPSYQNFRVRVWMRIVESGDTAVITFDENLPNVGADRITYAELEGTLAVDVFDTTELQSNNPVPLPWGTVTPSVTAVALLGGGVIGHNVDSLNTHSTPNGSATELADPAGNSRTPMWMGYEKIDPASGTYSMSSTKTVGGLCRGIGGYLVAFNIEEEDPDPPDPPDPTPAPGVDLDIHDPTDLTLLGSITDAKKKTIRIELQGTGQATVSIRRDSPNATAALIKRGNWVKVTIPRIWSFPIFMFRIETIETTVIDEGESGGEEIVFGGRGALVYLENYVAWNESFVVPAGKDSNGGILHGPASTGNKAGQILKRMLDEAQHEDRGVSDFGHRHEPVPLLSYDFDYDDDSDGNTWATTAMTEELSQGYVGDTGLSGLMELMGTDEIDITIHPWEDASTIPLRAYNSYGRDLTGEDFATDVVRFVRAVNIAQRLKSSQGTTVDPNIMLVQGQDNVYGYAENHGSDPHVEGFASTFGTDTGALDAIGLAEIARRIRVGQSVAFRVTCPKVGESAAPLDGLYLPGPDGSDGHYWIGDTVTLDTGTGYGDFDNTSVRVMAITITHDGADNLVVVPEVRGTLLVGRLVPTTGGRSSSGTATGGSGAPAPPPAGAIATGHVTDPTDAHDASAISVLDTGGNYAGTNVEDVLAELAGASGDAILRYDGAAEWLEDHGGAAVGATETIDLADGNSHSIILDVNCTLTFTGAVASIDGQDVACSFTLKVTQDATGGNAITWPGSVVWPDLGSAPDLSLSGNAVEILTFWSDDGGTTWYGFHGSGGGSSTSVPPAILLESGHATPFTFDDILQESDGSDFLWASA